MYTYKALYFDIISLLGTRLSIVYVLLFCSYFFLLTTCLISRAPFVVFTKMIHKEKKGEERRGEGKERRTRLLLLYKSKRIKIKKNPVYALQVTIKHKSSV